MTSGGCQCGAVRYRAERIDKPSICHCRMCQKAFGNFFAPLATTHGLTWTRGEPSWFDSSNNVRRGFCSACGTPLSYDYGQNIEIAIATLDDPSTLPPLVQVNVADKIDYVDHLHSLPVRENATTAAAFIASIVSYQHPDHDTESWPDEGSK